MTNTNEQDERLWTQPKASLSDVTLQDIPDIHKKCFLFDIDGVLCDPQQPISAAMKTAVNSIARTSMVYFVTGNSMTKSIDLLSGVVRDGLFCNSADELRSHSGNLLWTEAGIPPLPPRIENTLQMLCGNDNNHFGNRIEWRSPRMINFSKCGRFANAEQRASADISWREDAVNLINLMYPEASAVIGGAVSIDIYSKGADKSRAALYVNKFLNKEFVFIGDKTFSGGNDYPIVEYCVNNPANIALTTFGADYTLMLIDKILKRMEW